MGTYYGWVLDCVGGRARCTNAALASMGALPPTAYSVSDRRLACSPSSLRSLAAPHSPPCAGYQCMNGQQTACCATAKAHDCQRVDIMDDTPPPSWRGA